MKLLGTDCAISLVDDTFIFSTKNQQTPLVVPAYVAMQTGTSLVLGFMTNDTTLKRGGTSHG